MAGKAKGARTPVMNKKVPATRSSVAGFLGWGDGDRFPQTLLRVAGESDVARACLNVRYRFTVGNGFADRGLSRMIANAYDRDTFDRLLSKMSYSMAYFEGVALHVGYNALGKIASLRHVPIEKVRLRQPDDLGYLTHGAVFPHLGGSDRGKEKLYTELPLFDPRPEIVFRQMEEAGGIEQYRGQLIYATIWGPEDEYYHVPGWYSTPRNMETDAQLTNYDFRNVTGGFAGSGVLGVLEKPRAAGEEGEALEDDPNSLESQIAAGMGSENAGTVLVYYAQSIEELAAMKALSLGTPDLADRYKATGAEVGQRICRQMDVPSELANVRRSSGAMFQSALEQKMAYHQMQSNVNPFQRHLQEVFLSVAPHWKDDSLINQSFQIENLNYFVEESEAVQAG